MVTWKPKETIDKARALRTEAMTSAERLLWSKLRSRQMVGAKFRRQHPLGPYILDFVCIERRLVIEVDGSQHAEAAQADHDERRTAFLADRGYRVLRFWNNEVTGNIEGVWDVIAAMLADTALTPLPPLPQAGEGE